ncbi:YfjL-like protein [Alkaliphilus peptidifermentans]|uniref:YfjL-like N-terminal domain-containing protein n=1 Tax=Alkaliphilus peptidifermentans DSM 18978 TaxID=1120976 RepID=A0A1G5G3X7_9FIRM|nr:hypothetical protein [Alkaliphilus peptidifermentans]SCY45398.1 hypothetical protein SAMN03080606_01573 [Alkaliphilus peptidifermentans DSM 18978]
MEEKFSLNYIKAEGGVMLTIILVSIMMLSNSMLSTIPIIIIGSFVMYFIGVRPWTIYIGAILMHIILEVAGDRGSFIIFVLPVSLVEISGGLLLAYSIKQLKSFRGIKQIIIFVFGLILVYGGILMHFDIYGNPIGFLKAQNRIKTYIMETYEGKLEIESIGYGLKMNDYTARVRSTEDFRNKGDITYYRSGGIGDDYHFRIEEKQAHDAKQILMSMIKQKTDIPISDIRSLSISIELPYNKYTPRSMYLGEEPIYVSITMEPNAVEDRQAYQEKHGELPILQSYESKEAFSKEAYKILTVLQDIGWPYTEINIESFLPDGNTAYNIVITQEIKIDNLRDLVEITEIVDYNKR